MKKTAAALLTVLLAGCQSGASEKPAAPQQSEQEQNIIAALKQTTDQTTPRQKAHQQQLEGDTFTGGYLGKDTPELREDIGVQAIEAEAVFRAVDAVYGNFHEHGVLYIKNQTSGADESGVWIGIKQPDEKSEKLAGMLQKQVDEGKILAQYIHIFQSEYSEKDNQDLAAAVSREVQKAAESHPSPDRVTGDVAVDIITRTVKVSHDFLTDEQIKQLKKEFPDQTIEFNQNGRMLPLPGEPDVSYPDENTTAEPSRKGSYVMQLSGDSLLAVAAKPSDFSETGGQSEHYGAIYFQFPGAAEKLQVGQRVVVEASGAIAESYPGQGRAKFITVLPAYQPKGAALTETEAVQRAIGQLAGDSWQPIRSVKFDQAEKTWLVTFAEPFASEAKETAVTVPDKK